MSKMKIGVISLYSFVLCFFFFSTSSFAEKSPVSKSSNEMETNQCNDLKKRLKRLEQPEPITIIKFPDQTEAESKKYYPSDSVSIKEVLDTGVKIPFKIIKSDPNYERPVYEKHWHSTYWGGRWSYIPARIQTALHRLFTTFDIGISGELEFKQNVGIDFPMFQNKTDLDLYIVVFQTSVTDVYTKGNQVVIVGSPKRTGVEVITIKTGDIHPSNNEKLLLVQLATDSNELDYSLISYQPPDFWSKQIQKAKEREKRNNP